MINLLNRLECWNVIKKVPPHNAHIWVEVVAHILFKETGEVHQFLTDEIWEEEHGEPSNYIWSEGNFSCDCNRHLFFQRAIDAEERAYVCGQDKYSVNLENTRTGQVYYREFDCLM